MAFLSKPPAKPTGLLKSSPSKFCLKLSSSTIYLCAKKLKAPGKLALKALSYIQPKHVHAQGLT